MDCSFALAAPLGGTGEPLVQHLAWRRKSEPQTLGKALLWPYKAGIHLLPSSSPAPFLCLSQTWGIFTERVPQHSPPCLIRSSTCCPLSFPAWQWSISLLPNETNRWMTWVERTPDAGAENTLGIFLPRCLNVLVSVCPATDALPGWDKRRIQPTYCKCICIALTS